MIDEKERRGRRWRIAGRVGEREKTKWRRDKKEWRGRRMRKMKMGKDRERERGRGRLQGAGVEREAVRKDGKQTAREACSADNRQVVFQARHRGIRVGRE